MPLSKNKNRELSSMGVFSSAFQVHWRRAAMCMAALGFAVTAISTSVAAQDAGKEPFQRLNEAEIKAKYQHCPDGYYTGPRPGKGVYTKDHFLWVVTPEFAERYCIPQEFVSKDLKGAEAVAFTVSENRDEERCSYNGVEERCGFPKSLRFELYFKSGTPLPMAIDTSIAMVPSLPSAYMIARSSKRLSEALRKDAPKPKREIPVKAFELSQIGISGIKDGKIVWPITTLHEQTYFVRVFEGIDYLAVEGSTGMFTNPRREAQDVRKFVISFDKLGDRSRTNNGRQLSEFAYLVELPESFSDKIRASSHLHLKDQFVAADGALARFCAEDCGKRIELLQNPCHRRSA
ncbi:hypothetical protein [Cupriavidus sp. a3]|uniref:hypothetical protein n=1 Tax=Cupriavidus sp. a3 TaxID=3242158 RepID=UPI003D9C0A43